MTSPGKLRPTRFAHDEGHTDVCYSDDGKYIITCGVDGDVRLFEGLDDDDCKSHTVARKAHCIAYQNNGIIIVGTDLNMIQSYTTDEGNKSGIITRFTSHPTHVQISKDKNVIAAASIDMTVKVHNVSAFKDLIFEGHEAPVLSVSIDPKGDFISSSSCDGTVKVWNFRTQTVVRSFAIVPKCNNYANSSTLCRLTFTHDGEYLIVPVEKQLHFYKRSNWKVDFNLQDSSITSVISVVCLSPCGSYVACGCRDGQIVIWNLNSKSVIANDKPWSVRAVTGLAFNPSGKDEVAFVNANGEMGTMENFLRASVVQSSNGEETNEIREARNRVDDDRPNSANSHLSVDEHIDDDSEISLSRIKAQLGFADDEAGTFLGLPASQAVESESRPESRFSSTIPTKIEQPTLPEPQKPFQPGMSPEHLTDRYMLWNGTGIVRQYRSNEENSIEVEFHNSQIHHPMHLNTMPDQLVYTMAALNEQALVLAAESQDEQLSKLEVHHFSAWDGSKEWQINFPEGEDVVAISMGRGWIAAATDKRNLRIFSTAGVQLSVHCIPGPVVCLAASNDQLMIVYHSGIGVRGQQSLSCVIVCLKSRHHRIEMPVPVPLSPNAFLVWAGFTDEGNPLIMDTAGIVRIFTGAMGSLWTIVLNSKNYAKGKSDHYFLIGANELESVIRCIFCKGSRYPPVLPKPHVTLLEFKIPLCDPDEEKSILEESLIRAKLLSQTAQNIDASTIEDTLVEINKKLKESMIKLFALACRADRESRAVDICESMSSTELIELAIKYSSKTHRMQLAERLSSVVETKMEEREVLERESLHPSQISIEENSFSAPDLTLINNQESPARSNPLLTALNRRNSSGKSSVAPANQINPFRKTPSDLASSSRGIALLDTLKGTKSKESPILRPVMRKPKVSSDILSSFS